MSSVISLQENKISLEKEDVPNKEDQKKALSVYINDVEQLPSLTENDNNQELQEDKAIHIRKKRTFTGLVPEKETLQKQLNEFLRENYNTFHTLLHTIRGAIASTSSNIWQDAKIAPFLTLLQDKLVPLIKSQSRLIDAESRTISLEAFDFLHINNMATSPEYKETLFSIIDDNRRNPYPYDVEFLSAIYSPTMDIKQKEVAYILLNILPNHPLVTPHILAQIAGDIIIEFGHQLQEFRQKYQSRYDHVVRYFKDFISQGSSRTIELREPLFMMQASFVHGGFHVGDDYGFCALLSYAFLYNISEYGIDAGIEKFKGLIVTLEHIIQLPYKTALNYHSSFFSFVLLSTSFIYEKYWPSARQLNSERLYRANVDFKLELKEVIDILFDPTVLKKKKNFIISSKTHMVAALREYKLDAYTNTEKLVIYFFNANVGAFEMTNKDILSRFIVRSDKEFAKERYSVFCIDDMKSLEKYMNHKGALLGDFLNNRFLDNPDFMFFEPEFQNKKNIKNEKKIKKYNRRLPKTSAIGENLELLQSKLNSLDQIVRSQNSLVSFALGGEDITEKLLDKSLLSNIHEELDSIQSVIELRDVTTKITNVADVIKDSLPEYTNEKEEIQKAFIDIEEILKKLYASLEESIPVLDKPSKEKNIAVVSSEDIRNSESDIYQILSAEEVKKYDGTLYSESDLQSRGIYDVKESIEIKRLMQDLDFALAELLENAELEPSKYIAPEVELAKLSGQDNRDFDVLLKDKVKVVDITTGKEKTLSVVASSFTARAKKLHEKLINLNNKMTPFYKGASIYSTVMTLAQARSMIQTGKVLSKLSTLEQAGFVINSIDASLDVTANTVGAMNKLYKTIVRPMSSLSVASRMFGRISGGVGIFSSGITIANSIVNYVQQPSIYTEMDLGFDVTNTALSVATAVYPPLALVTIPFTMLLDIVKQNIVNSIEQERQREEKRRIFFSIVEQMEEEASLQFSLRKNLNVKRKDGTIMIPMRGDIYGILFTNDDSVILSMLDTSGVGYRANPASSALFPKDRCFSSRIVKTKKCPWSIRNFSDQRDITMLLKICKQEFLIDDIQLRYYIAPTTSEEAYSSTFATKHSPQIKDVQSVLLSDSLVTVKNIKRYFIRQGYTRRLDRGILWEPNMYDYRFDLYRSYIAHDNIHRLMLCSGLPSIRLHRKHWNRIFPGLEFSTPYIGSCSLVERRCVHIRSQSSEIKTVILSPYSYSSQEEFKQKMEQITSCKINNIDQYACSIIEQSDRAHIQIFLQGSNKVDLLPYSGEESSQYGFIFTAEDMDTICINYPFDSTEDTTIYLYTGENPTLRYGDVSINLEKAIKNMIPLYIKLDSGFIVSLSSNYELQIILYSVSSDEHESSVFWNYYEYKAQNLGQILRDKIATFLGNNVVPSIFQVEGIYDCIDGCDMENRKTSRISFFVPKEIGGKDRVVVLRIPEQGDDLIVNVGRRKYELLHIENFYHSYIDKDKLKEEDKFTAYFYNDEEKILIVQKGDTYIDSSCIFYVQKKPQFTIFGDGEHRLLIQGIAIQYDEDIYPKEVHITAEALATNPRRVDEVVHAVANLMNSYSIEQNKPLGKILFKDIPYQSKSGEKYNVDGYFDLSTEQYVFNIATRDGKQYIQLPSYCSLKDTEVYCALQDENGYRIYMLQPLVQIADVVVNGVILEKKMPQLNELFLHVDIKKIIPHKKGVILQEANGNILLGVLNGQFSYMKVISISEKFMKDNGYSQSNKIDTNKAINLAQLLYGEVLDPNYILIAGESNNPYIFNMWENESIVLDAQSFFIDKTESYKKRVHVKLKQSPPYEPMDFFDTSLYEELSPLSLNLLGSHKNSDGSQSIYMWCNDAEALLVDTKPPSLSHPNRVYQLGVFLQNGETALLRMDENHFQDQNVGIVIPGISSLIFQPSFSDHTIVFNYSSEQLQHFDEIILDASEYTGVFPRFHFTLDLQKISVSRFANQDVRITMNYKEKENDDLYSFNIILVKFFRDENKRNMYTNCLVINRKSYTTQTIMESIDVQGI